MNSGLLERAELERREAERLAPYAMPSKDTAGREHEEPEHPLHTPYQRDRERVIHSRAFRRLQYKTQVFVNHEGDYYRTRLTHTVEAAELARSVARALRLNEDLTETIALAHDLGHPPFGHAGERALASLMSEHGGFEHNAQALRLVDLLERRFMGFRGLNLSYEVREGIWKQRDTPTCRALGYADTFHADLAPLLEAQVADVVDGIAYDHHDLDDALKSGLLRPEDLAGVELWERARETVEQRYAEAGPSADRAERVWRQEIVRTMRRRQVEDLIRTTQERVAEAGVTSHQQARGHGSRLVGLSSAAREQKTQLQRVLETRVYRHYRVIRLVEKAKRFLQQLFESLLARPEQLPDEYQEWVGVAGLERAVCDYLAGMTDRYAQREVQKLFHPFEPM